MGDNPVELDLQRFYNINRRILMWILFFVILLLLQDFFAVMFLTFIFGFIMRKVARFLSEQTRLNYSLAVIIPYLVTLTLMILLISTAIPRVVEEGASFSRQVPLLLNTLASEIKDTAHKYGMEDVLAKFVAEGTPPPAFTGPAADAAPPLSPAPNGDLSLPGPNIPDPQMPLLDEDPDLPPAAMAEAPPATQPGVISPEQDDLDTQALAAKIQETLLGLLPGVDRNDPQNSLPELLFHFIRGVVGGTLEFLLAFLLSFLIVLDFDKIGKDLRQWRQSPVGRFFHEATSSVWNFSGVVGSAFQCQMLIAVFNAAITCVGMAILGIGPLLLLTTIVLLFGLIPVLGVFISSVPIILIAFNDYGIVHALLALGMIVIVHMIEAYVLNPRIYAARFHLNPVIVLIILLVAHESFGVWGMLLGIPVTHYVLNIAQMPGLPGLKRRRRRKDGEPEHLEDELMPSSAVPDDSASTQQ